MPVNTSANQAIANANANADTASSALTLVVKGTPLETGQYIPRADTQSPPEIQFFDGTNRTFLAIMLDMEAPFPSFNFLSPILHWIQPGLTLSGQALISSENAICDYAAARPPPGSGPHQYVIFLYEQPAGFEAKKFSPPEGQKVGLGKRVRFDLDAFEKEAGLGDIIACNYFRSN